MAKLYFSEDKVLLKMLFKTVAVFNKEKLEITRTPMKDVMNYKAIELIDGEICYECLLNNRGIEKLSNTGWI